MSAPILVILGAGGHGRVVADAALAQNAWAAVFATDRDPARCSGELLPGVPLLPLETALTLEAEFHVAIGSASSRERECAQLGTRPLARVVHPRAAISPFASVGEGCFVAGQAVVAPGARLGKGVIVNHAAVVDHDARVSDFSHLAPHCALGGGVWIGAGVLVGSGARVLPGLRVGDGVTLGAQAVVLTHIDTAGVYAGVPARRVR